jgi:hypothetical protein
MTQPFTPHDLRRTAATLAGDLGFDDAWIAKCLDHGDEIEVVFEPDQDISERVIFPVTGSQSNGIEDARYRDKAERARSKFVELQVLIDSLDRAISGEEGISATS